MQQLVIRNLNASISEGDLRQALSTYGNVMSIRMHPNGFLATVRMGAEEAGRAAAAGSITVNGTALIVEIDQRFNQQGGRGGFQPGFGRGMGHPRGGYPPQQFGGYPGAAPQPFGGFAPQPTTARIQIRVENCLYPINNAVLSQALGMVAPALRVEAFPASNQTVVGTAEYSDYATADNVVRSLNGKSIYPDCCRVLLNHAAPPQQAFSPGMTGGRGGFGMPMDGRGRGMGMGMGRGRGMGDPSAFTPYDNVAGYQDPVVIVQGVPEDCALKNIWTLLECYGNVRSVRRQFNTRTSVIATLYSHNDLRTMLYSVNNCPFYGSTLTIKSFAGFNAKGGHQTEWNSGLPTDPATLAYDFSTSHHRSRPSDKQVGTVRKGRPSKFLFITSLSDKITDDMVKNLFTSKGYTVLDFERKSDTIAIIDLESIDVAVRALCDTHATQFDERYIKVSFSLWAPHSVAPVPAAAAEGDDAAPAATAGNSAPAPTEATQQDAEAPMEAQQ